MTYLTEIPTAHSITIDEGGNQMTVTDYIAHHADLFIRHSLDCLQIAQDLLKLQLSESFLN